VHQKQPLLLEHLRKLNFTDDVKGKRDKALLLVGFATGMRRSELASMKIEHGEVTASGLRIKN